MAISYSVLREDDSCGQKLDGPLYSRGTVALVLAVGMGAAFAAGAGLGGSVFRGASNSDLQSSTLPGSIIVDVASGAPDDMGNAVVSSVSDVVDDNDDDDNPCGMAYWKRHISADGADEELIDLSPEDMGFIYQSFSIGGRTDAEAKDGASGKKSLERDVEYRNSVACLNKTLPGFNHQKTELGDYPSYTEGVASIHAWAGKGKSPYAGTFFTDTDVVANPFSKLNPLLLTWALQNVDLALVYNPNRAKGYDRDSFNNKNFLRGLQNNGLQGGFVGYRNSTRAKLFHGCVEHTLLHSAEEGEDMLKQQRAINKVLQSPVGQLIRTRWLPAEFQCWAGGKVAGRSKMSDWVIPGTFSVVSRDTNCFFIHSHYIGGVEACYD